MRPYEVMVIFDTAAEPSAIQGVIERALETMRGADGNPGSIDRWGKRAFAYEVNHKREGYYVVIEFTGESATVAALDRFLSLADEVIRHKVIRLPDKVAGRSAVPAATTPAATTPAPSAPAPSAPAAATTPPAAQAG